MTSFKSVAMQPSPRRVRPLAGISKAAGCVRYAGRVVAFATVFATVFATSVATAGSALGAETYCSQEPLAVPDGLDSALRSVVVPPTAPGTTIASVRVSVELTHPWIGDLRVVLRHPSGTEVLLVDRPGFTGAAGGLGFPGPWGCGGNGFDVTFGDSAIIAAEEACETVGVAMVGEKRPTVALATLVGLPPSGSWDLVIEDQVAGDAGTLMGFCLEITTATLVTCPEDLDRDGSVAGSDLAILLGLWGQPCVGCGADLTGDGQVDAADLALLLGGWGVCPNNG
jgi:subtilisin-like proprotein convertase family protein